MVFYFIQCIKICFYSIYFDAQIVLDLASGSLFELVFETFWHVLIFLCTLFCFLVQRFMFILYFSSPIPGISHFSNIPWSFIGK